MYEFTMRIAGIAYESVVDGPGLRNTVFFQGCPHACPGCHNPETWDPAAGLEYSLQNLLAALKLNPLISGVTFSGGEPFLQAEAAAQLGEIIKAQGLNLWVYTGYTWEYLLQSKNSKGFNALLKTADVLIDGPFIDEHKSLNLPFRGSANQRIIRVKESVAAGTIVSWRME